MNNRAVGTCSKTARNVLRRFAYQVACRTARPALLPQPVLRVVLSGVTQLADHERDIDRLGGRMQMQHCFVNGAIGFAREIGRLRLRGHFTDLPMQTDSLAGRIRLTKADRDPYAINVSALRRWPIPLAQFESFSRWTSKPPRCCPTALISDPSNHWGFAARQCWQRVTPSRTSGIPSTPTGRPVRRSSARDTSQLLDFLGRQVAAGFTILSWNGLGFDFDILAEESGRHDLCSQLAVTHVDLMFHLFCEKGFAVGLDAAAKALCRGASERHAGSAGPQMWAEGQTQQVLKYVADDCQLTLDVAKSAETDGRFAWITRRAPKAAFI